MRFRFSAFVAALVLAAGGAAAQDLSRHFEGIDGTFVLLNATTGAYTRHKPARAAERLAPCSTSKVPNTAILLESGVAPDAEYLVKYDPALKVTNADWARDHTLRSAFKSSVVWYYIALSRRVGLPAETRFVTQFGYGNQDTSGGVDDELPFWLDGTLRISANGQVEFLKRFHEIVRSADL
jgi:beta-lactamase class D